jgi:hypothetical protein
MSEEIDYKDLINLGFERFNMNCATTKNQLGHDDFGLELDLNKRFSLLWMQGDRRVKIMKCNQESDIKSQFYLQDLSDVKRHINLFKGIPNEEVVSTPLMA